MYLPISLALDLWKFFFVEIQVWVGLKMHFNQVLFPTIYKVVHNIWNTQYKTDTSILYLSLMTNDSASAKIFYLIWTFWGAIANNCILEKPFLPQLQNFDKKFNISIWRENKRRECTILSFRRSKIYKHTHKSINFLFKVQEIPSLVLQRTINVFSMP